VFESQFWNDAVESAIRDAERLFNCRLNIIKRDRPRANKYDRMLQLQPYYQNGRFFYSEKLKHKKDHQVAMAQLFGIEPGYNTKDDYPDAKKGVTDECEKYVTFSGSENSNYKSGLMRPKNDRI
jgi:hypothetical protein